MQLQPVGLGGFDRELQWVPAGVGPQCAGQQAAPRLQTGLVISIPAAPHLEKEDVEVGSGGLPDHLCYVGLNGIGIIGGADATVVEAR